MYVVTLGTIEFPIAPSRIELSIRNQNKTITLINEGEVNLLKQPGLTEISFDARIPQQRYPFTRNLQSVRYYLDALERMKLQLKPVRFTVSRGAGRFATDLEVSLEDYKVTEDAGNGFDLLVAIKLKEYRFFSTKTIAVTQTGDGETATATVQETREPGEEPAEKSHQVVSGDSLWNIAKYYLGDGSRYKEIYEINKDKIVNPNLIYPGQVLVLP